MGVITAAGRALLGWLFVHAGWRVVRKPEMAANLSAPSLKLLRERIPFVPTNDIALVRANAAVHVASGALLVAGKAQRLSALVLAASLIPTTAAGHPFWTIDDPMQRRAARAAFDKNVAIFGGLLVAAGASPSRSRRRHT